MATEAFIRTFGKVKATQLSTVLQNNAKFDDPVNQEESGNPFVDPKDPYGDFFANDDHNMIRNMRMMHFIWALPRLDMSTLAINQRVCLMCNQPYHPIWTINTPEVAVGLPCGHVVGHHCIRQWLSPFEMGETRCPFDVCRITFPSAEPSSGLTIINAEAKPATSEEDDKTDSVETDDVVSVLAQTGSPSLLDLVEKLCDEEDDASQAVRSGPRNIAQARPGTPMPEEAAGREQTCRILVENEWQTIDEEGLDSVHAEGRPSFDLDHDEFPLPNNGSKLELAALKSKMQIPKSQRGAKWGMVRKALKLMDMLTTRNGHAGAFDQEHLSLI